VKLWEPNEYPQLVANEHFCLTVAKKCGLDVPPYRLAEDAMALVIDRFDLKLEGSARDVVPMTREPDNFDFVRRNAWSDCHCRYSLCWFRRPHPPISPQ